MSAVVNTYISCDGGVECPYGSLYGVDTPESSAKQHRAKFAAAGWVYRGGKDYCPDCAFRLGLVATKHDQCLHQ